MTHDAMRQLFFSYAYLKDNKQLVTTGLRLLLKFPMDAEVLARLYTVLCDQDKAQEAVIHAQGYYQRDSTNLLINRTLANCFFLNRQYRDAIYQYQRLMAAGDTTFLGLYSVGMSYNYLGNKQQAYDYLLQAVKKNDKSAGCNYRLGIVCIDLERHEEALKYLFDAEYLLQPDRIIMKVIHDHKAKAYYAQGKYIWAIESWKKARECDGTSLAFIYNIGSCYAALYETAKADGTFDGHPINVAQMLEQARSYYGLFLEMATDNGDEPDEETQEMIQSARQYLEQAQE